MADIERRLTNPEAERLEYLEDVIRRGRQAFVEVGYALAEIRESKLYRQKYPTFEDYCRDRWDFSRSYAHRLTTASEVVDLLPTGNIPMPVHERQARELAPLKDDPEKMAQVWAQAVEESRGQPTAATIQNVRIDAGTPARRMENLLDEIAQQQLEQEPLPQREPKFIENPPPVRVKSAEELKGNGERMR
jgi:hypothetical protein